ncbi:T9SS C-terminal target domain-containing protein [Chitinophaga lutea]|uniref:T9SS C-terminal target domain-containing protein n=1 Tax=Chitinophaga lutea TaxID=2488634 RepID=A0A3N4Q9G0_9BACT|nr:PKD domain-containing protein [Chitinophaga lutea]RPE08354.1 T9SS C-terminal target domain-containing protein [Chitinophaga lutea]
MKNLYTNPNSKPTGRKERRRCVLVWMMFLLFAMAADVQASGTLAPPRRVRLTVNTPDNGFNYPNAMTSLGLLPGDIIEVPAGDYAFLYLGNIKGTAESPVQVINVGGQVRLGVNNKASAGGTVLAVSTCSNLEISGSGTPGVEYGFDINGRNTTGGTLTGIYLGQGSTDVDVHHINIHDVSSFIVAKTTQSCNNPQWLDGAFTMRNVKIHKIRGRNAAYEGFYIGNTNYLYTPGGCPEMRSHWLENLLVYDNDLETMGQDGIQISLARGPNNKVYGNRLVGYGKLRNDAHGYGILCGGGSSLEIYNNNIYDGYFAAVTIFGSGLSKVYNNLIRNIEVEEGVSAYDKIPSGVEPGLFGPALAYVYNNTIINTNRNQDAIKIYASLTTVPHQVYNNLMIVNGTAYDTPEKGIYARGAQPVLIQNGNNLQMADINAAGFVNVAGSDFHLTATSTSVDKGRDMPELTFDLDNYARPSNGKYDIGAYEYRSTPPNVAPAANAGGDQTVLLPATTATLDGSASRDSDGTIASYNWAKVSGPAGGNLSDAAAIKPTLSALQAGTYVFELTVTDNLGASGKDQVSITVNDAPNQAPIANAGLDQTVALPLSSTTLDGSGSRDNDGTITYAWTKISGPAGGNFTDVAAIKPIVTSLQAGTYVFQLTVTDNKGATASDQITVNVTSASNQAPIANAGLDQTVALPLSSTTLDGSGSRDNDGTITYAWTKISGPAGGNFTDAAAIKPIVTSLQAGSYVFQLTVTDDKGAIASDQMTVNVTSAANVPPTANAGPDQTLSQPVSSATLDGSASSDSDGTLTYNWTKTSGPSGGTFNDATAVRPVVSGLQAGTYVFQLTVIDNNGATAADQVSITVLAAAGKPVANAGPDQQFNLPRNTATLDGSASSDAQSRITGYRWVKMSGPDVKFSDPNAAVQQVSQLAEGPYVFQLTVTNEAGQSATATTKVTVLPAPNKAPVAVQGNFTLELPKSMVEVDGSASYDEDGKVTGYAWEQLSGPRTALIWNKQDAKTAISNLLLPGDYIFRLSVTDNLGAKGFKDFSILVLKDKNEQGEAPIVIFPNPVVNMLHLSIQMPAGETKLQLQFFNTQGMLVGTDQISGEGRVRKDINVSGLTAGIYLLKITGSQGYTYTHRFAKVTSAGN